MRTRSKAAILGRRLRPTTKLPNSRPKDPEPHLSAALLAEHQKDFPAAESEYKKALALDPHSAEAVIGLTNVYMKSNRLAEAEPMLRRLAAERTGDAAIHLQLGRVLAAQK